MCFCWFTLHKSEIGEARSTHGTDEKRMKIYIFAIESSENWNIRMYDPVGAAVAQLIEALRYKPERRGFDSRLRFFLKT